MGPRKGDAARGGPVSFGYDTRLLSIKNLNSIIDDSAMRFIVFVMHSLAGFVLGMICTWIIIPIAFAGEVFNPMIVPIVGMVYILLTALPFTIVQGWIEFSSKTRQLVPFLWGVCWLPLFFLSLNFLPFLVFRDVSFWIAVFKTGFPCTFISFVFSLLAVKTADMIRLCRSY